MALSKEDVKKIGKLARIRLEGSEIDGLGKQINDILKWIEQLQEVNTDGVQPMSGTGGGHSLRLREDKISDGNIRDQVLANAPDAQFDCFVVPKVVE